MGIFYINFIFLQCFISQFVLGLIKKMENKLLKNIFLCIKKLIVEDNVCFYLRIWIIGFYMFIMNIWKCNVHSSMLKSITQN